MAKKLGDKVRAGFGWDLIGTFFKQVSVLTVSVVLARLLSPEEFGIIGMAMVFVSISQVFVDIGFTQGLIQSQKNTKTIYSSVFYLNIFLGILICILLFFLAPLIGSFYEMNQVITVVQWLCFIPLISAFGSVQKVQFTKRLDFKTLTICTVFSTIVGGITGVTIAFFNYGVYALIAQQITTAIVFTVFLWIKSDWKPSWVFSFKEIKRILNFSIYVFFDNLLRTFFNKLDTLFVGKYFSAASLGFYSRAESLNAQITQYTTSSLGKVIFPTFSKLQENKKVFEANYFKVFDLAVVVTVLISGPLFFLAEDIIITLLGDKWQPSVIIFQILVFKILISPFGVLTGKSLLARGFSKKKFQINQMIRVLLLVPIYVGYLYGLNAFLIALIIAKSIGFIISLFTVHTYLNISFIDQLIAFLRPIVPFLIMVLVYYYFQLETNPFLLTILFLVLEVIYLFLLKNNGLFTLKDVIKNFTNL